MFATKIGGSRHGINIAIGAAGSERTFLTEYVIKEARLRGWSTKKYYNRLENGHGDYAQVVS